MTLLELIESDKVFFTPAEVAPTLEFDPNVIRRQAQDDPSKLGFNVIHAGSRTKIPRKPFLEFLGYGDSEPKDYTPLPFEYLDELDCLSDEEYGRLIRALQHYSITGEETQLTGREMSHWKRVRNYEARFRDGGVAARNQGKRDSQEGNA